ncbi:hypothetical protein XJ44_08890 [Thermosipho affectus]|uniref:RNase H type-1 domain-containing protein n=1 Tax=Thermosipho affectus TaxID=660294 RepID=A0ABX3IFG6_9BACT|nr:MULTISPECIES: RNase H family protein [Thermosipho]ANQ54692.1 hypothetical protein Y592_09085 [Thermosipho sp. 1070]APT73081.1 hypothetical protein BG95_08980 [Thermosipho sp. 1063]ONN26565.1 hypothetical protein XJ44_08890 [Thermosipho affectus]OOC42399.1 hypothetical protein XO08_09025 [Thermosipho sp. 1074]
MVTIYVDGSWNCEIPDIAGWGFVALRGKTILKVKKGIVRGNTSLNSTYGEFTSVIKALEWALSRNITEVTIAYDFLPIEKLAIGKMKPYSEISLYYLKSINYFKQYMNIYFKKVKAHSRVEYNEWADSLAKRAISKKIVFGYRLYQC